MNLPIFAVAGTLGLMLLGGLTPPARAWGAAEESYILPNGLKVILVEQPGNPVISMRVMIRTGSADEAARSEYGLAHLMEHMAFKGSLRYPEPGVISSLVERNGGDMNAYTSTDSTVYYLNLPSDQAALGLDILSELVFHPLYDPREYELEKEVVIEEIKRGRDNPDRLLSESFFEAAYPDHPYGRPVLGFEDTVRSVTVQEAKAFHSRHYRPDNAVLVVTGGFKAEAIKAAVKNFYAGLEKPAAQLGKAPAPALAPPAGPVLKVEQNDKMALAKVLIGFRGPAGRDAEAPTMDLLASVLSGGNASRLTEVIKDEKGLVTDISAGAYTPRYQGSFFISLETEPDKVLAAVEAVQQELERLIASPPDDGELSRARALAEKSFLSGQESALGLAGQITEFENLFGDWRLRDAYLPLWNRTGQAELTREAARHFRPKNMTLVLMLPPQPAGARNAGPTEEDLAALARRLSPPALAEAADSAPAFQEMRLKAGPRLLVMRDAALPLVSARAAALGGLLAEDPGREGLNNFMTSVWAKATVQKPAAALSRAFEDIGATISAFSGRNSVGLSASFLAARRDEGFRLFAEVLTSPIFSPEDVERVRPEILAQIKAQEQQLGGRVMRLLAKNLYPGGHPYSRDLLGSAESIAKMDAAALKKEYERLIRPQDILIAVAGDVEPQKVRETLDEILADWKPGGQAQKVQIPKAPRPIKKFTEIKESLDRAQTHLAYGFQAPGLGSADGPALDVLAAYLSGMSGPLFRELRDRQSLAYTVQCGYNPGLAVGSFTFYIASDPTKVEAALKGFNEIIERTRNQALSGEELEGAKRYLVGSTKIRLQTVSSRSGQAILNSLYGLGLDYEDQRLKAIEKVTAEEVRAAAAKYLNPDRGVLSVLGRDLSRKTTD
ncbi:MAG: insulinase family protein [Candidatus Adiutrix sp.]|jgi:zinc protease|nr:insulinase family protein [Candidatus Adiutrix sp.]